MLYPGHVSGGIHDRLHAKGGNLKVLFDDKKRTQGRTLFQMAALVLRLRLVA